MVSVCLPSDALLQHLLSYLGFSYLGRISSQLLQQSAATPPYLGRGVSPHCRPSWAWTWTSSSRPSCARTATTPWTWGCSSWPPTPGLRHWVAPPSCHPWPRTWGSSSRLFLRHRSLALSALYLNVRKVALIGFPLGTLVYLPEAWGKVVHPAELSEII